MNKFKIIRENSGLTAKNFAKNIVKCSTGHWSDIETGKSQPNYDDLQNIFEYRQKELSPKTLNLSFYLSPDYGVDKGLIDLDKIFKDDFNEKDEHSTQEYKQLSKAFKNCETIEDLFCNVYGLSLESLDQLRKIKSGRYIKDKLVKTAPYTINSLNKFVESTYFLQSLDFMDKIIGSLDFSNNTYPNNRDKLIYELTSRLSYFATRFIDDYIADKLQNTEISKDEIKNKLQTKKDSTN